MPSSTPAEGTTAAPPTGSLPVRERSTGGGSSIDDPDLPTQPEDLPGKEIPAYEPGKPAPDLPGDVSADGDVAVLPGDPVPSTPTATPVGGVPADEEGPTERPPLVPKPVPVPPVASAPVADQPVEKPAAQKPVDTPAEQRPVDNPAEQKPVDKPAAVVPSVAVPQAPNVAVVPDWTRPAPSGPQPAAQAPAVGAPGATAAVPLAGVTRDVISATGLTISRPEVMARALTWVVQRVPYSQARWWRDENGTYRQDCSGYVSMSWRLDQRNNYWTGNLGTVSNQIAWASLKPGDVLNLARKHVVIFGGWANAERTKFNLYEQYASGASPRYAVNASLAYYLSRGYSALRYEGIVRAAQVRPGTVAIARRAQAAVAAVAEAQSAEMSATATAPDDDDADLEQILPPAGIESVPWTPELAADFVAETAPPAQTAHLVTPAAAEERTVEDLVEAQRAVDVQAELTASQADGSSGGYVVVAGLGLIFLAVPLGIGARAGVWSPSGTAGRKNPAGD